MTSHLDVISALLPRKWLRFDVAHCNEALGTGHERVARNPLTGRSESGDPVREELGYPPLVTPTSQVVRVQAVMNVLHGRYKVIPKETKDYCRGMSGRPPGEIKPEVMKKVLGQKWKEDVIDCRPSDLLEPLWDQKKKELKEIDGGSLIKKEEDVMTYILYPQVGLKFLKGQAIAEFTSDILPLPIDHQMTRAMVKQSFPEVKQLWLETQPPEKRGGPVQIPTEFQVEVDGAPYEVKVIPSGGYLVAGAGGATQQEKPKDRSLCIERSHLWEYQTDPRKRTDSEFLHSLGRLRPCMRSVRHLRGRSGMSAIPGSIGNMGLATGTSTGRRSAATTAAAGLRP